MSIRMNPLSSAATAYPQARPITQSKPELAPAPALAQTAVDRPTAEFDVRRPEGAVQVEVRGGGTRSRSSVMGAPAELASANARLTDTQAAAAVLKQGRADLETLGALASAALTDPAERQTQDVAEVTVRLQQADEDEALLRTRARIDQDDTRLRTRARIDQDDTIENSQDQATQARTEADRLAKTLEVRPAAPQPTLTLTVRTDEAGEQRRSDRAETTAVQAEGAADRLTRRAEVLGTTSTASPPPILAPPVADVSTPEAAAETVQAVGVALQRTERLSEQVQLLGTRATRDTQAAVSELGASPAAGRRVMLQREAQTVARTVAAVTIEDPHQALATQPYITVEAALRVLS